jgi:hypothetical protein
MEFHDPEEQEQAMEVEGGHEEGDEEEMMDVEDIPVTQEDAWAVIRCAS